MTVPGVVLLIVFTDQSRMLPNTGRQSAVVIRTPTMIRRVYTWPLTSPFAPR